MNDNAYVSNISSSSCLKIGHRTKENFVAKRNIMYGLQCTIAGNSFVASWFELSIVFKTTVQNLTNADDNNYKVNSVMHRKNFLNLAFHASEKLQLSFPSSENKWGISWRIILFSFRLLERM